MASDATFLLGVGAQKAGTSWLHDQLNRRSDADFGFLKEYHIFDALELERFANFRPKRPTPLKWRTWRRARFIARPERYFDYFASRLKPPQIRLTGDITPSYAGLSAESYQRIQKAFARRANAGGVHHARPGGTVLVAATHAIAQAGLAHTRA